MKFGIFDHLDRAGGPDINIGSQYRDRLRLVEEYDRAGLYAYHLAEHHGTPLGLAPAPSLFLAAVAQRTANLRFGPLVYVMSLQHPLRMLEEACMLDHLSGGRLELGIGRGASPIELSFFDITEDDAAKGYEERVAILLAGFDGAEGPGFALGDVPMLLRPVQRPHPPLWIGISRLESARWAAERGINVVANGLPADIRKLTDAYRAHRILRSVSTAQSDGTPMPLLGMNRHIVIADTDAEARDLARRAYVLWYHHLNLLWRGRGFKIPLHQPASFDDALASGLCLAGSSSTVRDAVLAQAEEAGINYLLVVPAFGDLPFEASKRSIDWLVAEVVPAFGTAAG